MKKSTRNIRPPVKYRDQDYPSDEDASEDLAETETVDRMELEEKEEPPGAEDCEFIVPDDDAEESESALQLLRQHIGLQSQKRLDAQIEYVKNRKRVLAAEQAEEAAEKLLPSSTATTTANDNDSVDEDEEESEDESFSYDYDYDYDEEEEESEEEKITIPVTKPPKTKPKK